MTTSEFNSLLPNCHACSPRTMVGSIRIVSSVLVFLARMSGHDHEPDRQDYRQGRCRSTVADDGPVCKSQDKSTIWEGAKFNDFCVANVRCKMTTIGYARVSTDGQTLDHQQAALRQAGCERVFSEKISGAVTDRPALAKAIAALGEGDTLIVCKLDRLARSTRDLLNTLAAVGEAGATFKSLGDQW